ncbi:eukaryotic aspartyl protease [Ancylostoma caninum]|uniref:Eukaryotic aspartyl protease n=1 Tax=Ancylostoma caninum TaxID=29170 RepID=A0A368G9G4_ANCCA|nr:eukaryotic aspartyl protease [Ancylostoma caninum]
MQVTKSAPQPLSMHLHISHIAHIMQTSEPINTVDMWTILLLANAFFLSAVHASNMTVKLHGTGSLIAKFIEMNTYDDYLRVLEKQERNRTKGRYWTWQALASWYDEFYLGEVKVGTPPQKFFLSMDTGSSVMWLIDGACNHPICNGYPNSGRTKNKFYYGRSSTFKRTSDHFSINYGTGWAGGFTGADDISYGTFVMKQQQFGVANSLGPFFGTAPMDGIFGLGFNEYPNAISDTGTTWIGVPNAVLNNILWQTQSWWDPNRKLYIIPCSKMWTLPRMIFHIAGRQFTVPSVQYVLDLNLGNGQCVMAMFAVDSAAFGAQFILGQPFIRTFCQTYDIANKRIGISVARPQKT